jgi:hypothetical protein
LSGTDSRKRKKLSKKNPSLHVMLIHGTFNPAVYQHKDGTVHLLYRAIGADGVSRVGYASSKDTIHFDEKLSYPVFAMQNPRPIGRSGEMYDQKLYPSGGSWYGVEDPRMVEIEGHLYLTFSVFGGWDFVRMGVASISIEDLLAQHWNWSKPKLISPEGQINKNWVLFPEKINGKFVIIQKSKAVLVKSKQMIHGIHGFVELVLRQLKPRKAGSCSIMRPTTVVHIYIDWARSCLILMIQQESSVGLAMTSFRRMNGMKTTVSRELCMPADVS